MYPGVESREQINFLHTLEATHVLKIECTSLFTNDKNVCKLLRVYSLGNCLMWLDKTLCKLL